MQRPDSRCVLRSMRFAVPGIAFVALCACSGQIGEVPGERSTDAPDPAPNNGVVIGEGEGEGEIVQPWPAEMRRLTTAQYLNTLEFVFGAGVSPDTVLPEDLRGDNVFHMVTSSSTASSQRDVELYHEASIDVAKKVLARKDQLAVLDSCAPSSATDPCIAQVVEHYGRLLWRRDLTTAEVDKVVGIMAAVGDEPDELELGLTFVVATLISAPDFLYVRFVGETDEVTGARRYTSMEMANRLAFVLTNQGPDDELLAAGQSGALVDATEVAEQTRRLLEVYREDLAIRFFKENWNVEGLGEIDKDTDTFPAWTPEVIDAAEEEFARGVVRYTAPGVDLFDVFVARDTEVNGALAPLYEVEVAGDDFEPVELPDYRSGLLTSVAVMSANAKPGRTSPTQRGVFLRSRVLCLPVPPPPDDAVLELEEPEPEPGQEAETLRARLERHRDDPNCAYCHALFDPMGFALEGYDGIGRYRTEEDGQPIDTFTQFEHTELHGARELGEFLYQEERAERCMVERFYVFATGHLVGEGEEPVIDDISARFREDGRVFDELVVKVTTSVGFRFMGPIEEVCQ